MGYPIVIDTTGRDPDIYRWWNEGCDEARARGAEYIAGLNDDIVIPPGAVSRMAQILRDDPGLGIIYPENVPVREITEVTVERTEGLWHSAANRGMTGCAFVIPANLPVRFDERYRWWAGDDAFEEGVRRAGYSVGCAVGVTMDHPDSSHSAKKRWDEIQPLVDADRAIWYGPERWA